MQIQHAQLRQVHQAISPRKLLGAILLVLSALLLSACGDNAATPSPVRAIAVTLLPVATRTDNPKINGFVVLTPVSAAASTKALRDILREPDESGYPAGCKTEVIWQTYDSEVAAFLQSLEDGTADVDDQQRFSQIKHVAESIQPIATP